MVDKERLESMNAVQLALYDRRNHDPGAPTWKRALWYVTSALVFSSPWVPLYGVKRWLLRAFGGQVGVGVVIKPGIKVKYPWKLSVGSDTWIGEEAWIDNIEKVTIGANCCISQGAYLCSGNHDWSDPAFALCARPIQVFDQTWIGAKAFIGPGVVIGEGAVISAGSVMTSDAEAWSIYSGNPAVLVRRRTMGERRKMDSEMDD